MQSCADETFFNVTIGIAGGGHGSEVERTDCQRTRDKDTQLQFLVRFNYRTSMVHSIHRKQKVFVANRVAEMKPLTDVSQWKHVSGIHNPVDIGNKAINVEELKRSEWLTGPTRLKQPEIEWPEQVNLVFA